MTYAHDLRAAFIDLRDNYRRSGWVDSGMEQSIQQMGEALGVCEGDAETARIVREVINKCIWDPGSDHETAMRLERDSVERLMRLIRHREGR